MENKDKLLHEKFHAELELMHEEAKPKIEATFKRLKRSHRVVMVVGILIAFGLVSSVAVSMLFIENSAVRTIVSMGLVFGTTNHIIEVIRNHRSFKMAEKGYKSFMEMDFSMEEEEKPVEQPTQKLKN